MIARIAAFFSALMLVAAPAAAADKLTILLDWFVNPNHAPLVIAQEEGIFDRHGLEVELVAPADPAMPPRLVAAGQADIAITYQPDFLMQLSEGLPLVRFGTLVETPLNALIVLEDGPIKDLADLKDKRVGYSVATIQTAYLGEMLKSVGLSADDVTLVNVNFNLVSALRAGEIDAAIDGYRNFELTHLRLEGHPGVAFYPEEHGVPIYDELIYVAHQDRRDDPLLARFLAAVEEATVYLTNHPDEAKATFIASNPDLDDELNRVAFDLTHARFSRRPAAMDVGRYERFADFLRSYDLIETIPPVEDYSVVVR
ncbi:ABC transporter substrate-binding protein [Bauldia sp.]|uniref:ABC transporter substrate-binding protein n=1 Tax=Bauldia sp. TaxID=2575872 RepID=UPI003BAB1972